MDWFPAEARSPAAPSGDARLARGLEGGLFPRVAAALRRRPARAALAGLALLYATAIYAPIVANDRPLYLRAVDLGAYRAALRELEPVSRGLGAVVEGGPEAWDRGHPTGPPWAAAVEREVGALTLRLATLERYAAAPAHERIARLRSAGEDTLRAARSLDPALARALHASLARECEKARTELAPRDPPAPPGGGVELRARSSSPLLRSLAPAEVFFMVLWAFVLLARPWTRLARSRPAAWGIPPAAAALAALAFALLVDRSPAGERSDYKRALASGELAAARAIFPPVAFSYGETRLDEAFRPPTFTSGSEIDAEGRYVRGPRAAPRELGQAPPSAPAILSGEPARNSPWRHPLGTDGLGRDLLARLLWGGRVSLTVGLLSALLLTAIGVAVGALAGYCGGTVDLLVSRAIDAVLSIPALFLVVLFAALCDPRALPPMAALVAVLAGLGWTGVARLTRAEMLRLRQAEFVLAARAIGCSGARTAVRHALPGALAPVIVAAAFAAASGILVESVVSFLGFGIEHPVPSWGALISESRSPGNWWIQLFPGLSILAAVCAYNALGEVLRGALDPRHPLDLTEIRARRRGSARAAGPAGPRTLR